MFTQFFNIREKDGDIRCYQKKTLQSVIGAFYIGAPSMASTFDGLSPLWGLSVANH